MSHSFFAGKLTGATELVGSYDSLLVILSYLVAVIAGFCALNVINFIKVHQSKRDGFILVGGVILGLGVWSMHFTGMLAFSLPFEVLYSLTETLLSILPIIIASIIVLYNVTKPVVTFFNILITGGILALGISTMHFVGMTAMSMPAHMSHDLVLTIAAVAVSWGLAVLTISIVLERIQLFNLPQNYRLLLGASVFGFSVATMHYLAMASTYFYPDSSILTKGIDNSILTYGLLVSSIAIMASFMVVLSYKSKVNLLIEIASNNHKRMVETIDNMEDGFVLTNYCGEILLLNNQFRDMYKQVAPQFKGVGDDINALYQYLAEHYFKQSESSEVKERLILKHENTEALAPVKLKTKDNKWWLVRRTRTPTNAVIQTWTDISAQVAQERDLVAAKDMAIETMVHLEKTQNELLEAKKMASLGSVVTGVAHELNTPLGVGITALSSIKEVVESIHKAVKNGTLKKMELDQSLNSVEQLESLAMSSLKRVAELIQQFKLISVEQDVERPRDVHLAVLMSEMLQSWRNELADDTVEFELQLDDNIKLFTCETALQQVLTSLFKNSLEHGFKSLEEAGVKQKIMIRTEIKNNKLILTYGDNGKGIDSSLSQNIFDPFVTTSRGSGQIGLGLYIAFNLVAHKLNGAISLVEDTSDENSDDVIAKGEQLTTFEISLPLTIPSD